MIQEDKDLLLKDLCSRLPYGVKMKVNYGTNDITVELCGLDIDKNTVNICRFRGESITLCEYNNPLFTRMYKSRYLPYLFPMSSMTEEQRKEFDQLIELDLKVINDEIDCTQVTAFEIDFYNKHHLDWRGLIEKGLALDASGKNIY